MNVSCNLLNVCDNNDHVNILENYHTKKTFYMSFFFGFLFTQKTEKLFLCVKEKAQNNVVRRVIENLWAIIPFRATAI